MLLILIHCSFFCRYLTLVQLYLGYTGVWLVALDVHFISRVTNPSIGVLFPDLGFLACLHDTELRKLRKLERELAEKLARGNFLSFGCYDNNTLLAPLLRCTFFAVVYLDANFVSHRGKPCMVFTLSTYVPL